MSRASVERDGPCDVFISYARADVAAAEELEAALTAAGKKVWRDKERLKPGDHVDFVIPEALRAAKAVVTVWSDEAAQSDWVRHETAYAVVERKSATLALAGFDYGRLPAPYKALNCGDLDATVADLTKLLEKLAEIEQAAAPAPPRLVDITRLPRASNAFVARAEELAMLRTAWVERQPRILALVAAGGTGKTMLSSAFLAEMAEKRWAGAEAVFAFSFDSQGTDEKRQGSSDAFFAEALRFFSVDPDQFDTVRKRAAALADICETRRVLMVLDGIEPMQSPRGDAEHGRLRDDAMSDFLNDLALNNKGLCIISTRLPLPDLAERGTSQVRQIRLRNLPLSDAVAMLYGFGVRFPQAQMEDICRRYGQVLRADDGGGEERCHAKAIALIGSFLKSRFKGAALAPTAEELRQAFAMPDEAFLGGDPKALKEEPGYAVYRMIRRYEILYEESAKQAKKALVASAPGRQLLLLRVIGLFDRPAPWGAVRHVLASLDVRHLSDRLDEVTAGEWKAAVDALVEDGLMNPPSGDGWTLDDERLIDAHPLVREYFGRRLALTAPEAAQEAHGRLYDWYRFQGLPEVFREKLAYAGLAIIAGFPENKAGNKRALAAGRDPGGAIPQILHDATPDERKHVARMIDHPEFDQALAAFLPGDEAGMRPLFAAIAHGAAAGRHDEAFDEVYWPRIARGNEKFAVHKLGLYGSDLAALAHFFAEPFGTPAPGLSDSDQALVLNLAGFALRALGRLGEAVEPMRVAVDLDVAAERWKHAAINAGNLSELLLTIGRVGGPDGAVAAAEAAVAHADRSGDKFQAMSNRTALADALAEAGRFAEAATRFREAEALQREDDPGLPLLYSLHGYRWCDLRLAQGRVGEVGERAGYAIKVAKQNNWLLDIALDTLSLGRAAAAALPWAPDRPAAVRGGGGEAARLLETAVEGLRAAGAVEFLARGLLACAAVFRSTGQGPLASKDLTEAFDIATRGGMQSHLIPAWIESGRQRLARAEPSPAAIEAAAKALATARRIMTDTGARRHEPALLLAEARLATLRSDRAAADRAMAAAVALMRAGDLWGFLPELESLAGPRPDLKAEQAAFDAREDEAFSQARGEPYVTPAPASAQPPAPPANRRRNILDWLFSRKT